MPVRRLRIMASQAQTLRTIARADQITHLIDTSEAPAVVVSAVQGLAGWRNRSDYTPAGVVRARAIQMATKWAG